MSPKEIITAEEYCNLKGIEPVPSTDCERFQAIFEDLFNTPQTRRPPLVDYLPSMAIGVVLGLVAFLGLKPWIPSAAFNLF